MRSELSFLMDLFLNEEISLAIKKMVADRIREVEEGLTIKPAIPVMRPTMAVPPLEAAILPAQAPSMQRIMQANPDIPIPVTPAAALALQQRAALISGAGSEKPEPGRKSPRKL